MTMKLTIGMRTEINRYLNHFKKDAVVQAWLKEAMNKPEKYKDRDLAFYIVVTKVIEDFAKLAVLTNFQKTTKILKCLKNLKLHEKLITTTAIESLKKEILSGRK